MTIIRTGDGLTLRDIDALQQAGYAIQAIETLLQAQGNVTDILWERDDGPVAIIATDLPF